jgi:hypothetical protein
MRLDAQSDNAERRMSAMRTVKKLRATCLPCGKRTLLDRVRFKCAAKRPTRF